MVHQRYRSEDDQMWSMLRLGFSLSGSSKLERIMQLGSAAVIIFENAFYLWSQQRPGLEQESVYPVRVALQQYIASPNAAAVRDAMSSAVRTYEAGFSHLIPGSANRSQKKAELIDTIFEIVSQHRLHLKYKQYDNIRKIRLNELVFLDGLMSSIGGFYVVADARAMNNVLLISDDVRWLDWRWRGAQRRDGWAFALYVPVAWMNSGIAIKRIKNTFSARTSVLSVD
ncbi:hypothetical protein C8R48DRAFT_838266 [Suillus tomentosus]|nr:hypothetical protein C8R48DRAFT_838266 [Suillus tomentosus]